MSGVNEIIQGLEDYKNSLKPRADALLKALADAGCEAVNVTYGSWPYTGPRDVEVTVEHLGELRYAIVAGGETMLFLEFGAGVYLGGGHPDPMGYGPGTYPGEGHWNDPRGWYLPKSALGESGVHTYGNAPSAAMYHTAKSLRAMLKQAVKGVFGA